ncbi:hypothetical protein PFISCL1PPCAC_13291, partial [Pristionchus fissidentatus]
MVKKVDLWSSIFYLLPPLRSFLQNFCSPRICRLVQHKVGPLHNRLHFLQRKDVLEHARHSRVLLSKRRQLLQGIIRAICGSLRQCRRASRRCCIISLPSLLLSATLSLPRSPLLFIHSSLGHCYLVLLLLLL